MKIAKNLLLLLVLFTVSLVACERKSHEQANKSGALENSPAYTTTINDATIVAQANIAEVAPNKGPEPIDGKALFGQVCAACHQATGQGVPGAFPPLDGSPYVLSDNVERMASIMLYGLKGPIKVKGVDYNSMMVAQSQFSNEQLAAIATYVRSAWSNKASAVDPSVFAKMREKWGTHTQFEISELGKEE